VLTCAAAKTVECGAAWAFDAPSVADHCDPNPAVRIVGTVTNAGVCAGSFTATRTWEAIDACTNRATCSQTVTLVDTTPPALTCGGDRTVECGSPQVYQPELIARGIAGFGLNDPDDLSALLDPTVEHVDHRILSLGEMHGRKAVIDSISIKAAGKRVTLGIGGTGGASLGGVIAALAMPSLMKTQAMLEGTGAMAVPTGNATPEPQAEAPVAQEAPSEATPTPRPATRPAPRATPRRAPPVAQAPPTTEAPAPAPTPRGPVRVGGDIQEPKKIKHVNPAYPETAKRARAQGMVILECNISTEGRVTDVKVLRGVPLLDQAAIDAVRQWVYTPTLLNGTPVPVVMTVTVNFRLN